VGVFDAVGAEGHEEVVFGSDPVSGLKTIIAIHSTALGPALGGTRFFPYATEEEALADVLRLSKAMTAKASAAGLDLGGGKAVIIGDPGQMKSERLWRAYGRIVDSLQGRYITAEDVGTDSSDMETIRHETRWVVGIPVAEGGSGDPSPATARGLMRAIGAMAEHVWGDRDISGKHFAIQGVGKVGRDLVRRLTSFGAKVTVADVFLPSVEFVTKEYGVTAVSPDDILGVECDVLAPCGMGGVINKATIPNIKAQAIVGSANNQLESDKDADRLAEAGVVYCPDFVVNSGGLINVWEEMRGYEVDRAAHNIDKIDALTKKILAESAKNNETPLAAAQRLASERVHKISQLRLFRRSGDDRN
jgi:leucine dehydrogenase